MTEAVGAPDVTPRKVGKTVAVALMMGLAIQLTGTLAWVTMIRRNVRESPDVPWAATSTACLLVIMLVWLSGRGWPSGTSEFRRRHLRLWEPEPDTWSGDNLTTILSLISAMVGLAVLYALIGSSSPPDDLSPYPTTAIRFSALIMTPMVAGVVEEMAFRGYMQRHLERIGPTFAIMVTSAAFTLLHITQGVTYLMTFGAGIFIASVVYGYLAQRSGSILPGMALHFVGDLAFAYFALLGGDSARLFVN